MKKLLVFIALFLCGCSTATAPKIVKVPIPIKCVSPSIPPMPHLPMYDLNENSPAPVVQKSLLATILIQQNYIDDLVARLKVNQ